jgi:hypothetical protein
MPLFFCRSLWFAPKKLFAIGESFSSTVMLVRLVPFYKLQFQVKATYVAQVARQGRFRSKYCESDTSIMRNVTRRYEGEQSHIVCASANESLCTLLNKLKLKDLPEDLGWACSPFAPEEALPWFVSWKNQVSRQARTPPDRAEHWKSRAEGSAYGNRKSSARLVFFFDHQHRHARKRRPLQPFLPSVLCFFVRCSGPDFPFCCLCFCTFFFVSLSDDSRLGKLSASGPTAWAIPSAFVALSFTACLGL